MNFVEAAEFQKEFKKIKKKYPSLDEDLEVLKKAIKAEPKGIPGIVVEISDLGLINSKAFKVRKFRCRYLQKGSNSGIRITYGFKCEEPTKIYLIEMYLKADKENEDRDRITKYLDQITQ